MKGEEGIAKNLYSLKTQPVQVISMITDDGDLKTDIPVGILEVSSH